MPISSLRISRDQLLRVFQWLCRADVREVAVRVLDWLRGSMRQPAPEGMYEVLAYHSRLELLDERGERAIFHKRQRVRFLQDHIIAYQDQAWGDGHIFAEYRCSPGKAVDRYREGHRWRVLISLRQTKNRGDVEEFFIERAIRNGFTRAEEDFQTEIDHVTHALTMTIVFPKARPPRQVWLMEQNAARTVPLGPDQRLELPDGRVQVTWAMTDPRRYEAYIVRWRW